MVGRGMAARPFGAVGAAAGGMRGAVAVLVLLVAWFGFELVTGAGQADLAERILGAAQAARPLTVVLTCRHPVRTTLGSTLHPA